jgi:predicted anti-sigma-YlaC factor YlaD
MKKCDEIQEILIDKFYDEKLDSEISLPQWAEAATSINKHIENCPECMEFKNKLYSASQKLDILEMENLTMPADLFNIINEAENIKVEKKKKFEICTFVAASISILIPFIGLGLYFGLRTLLYMQIILYLNMPLVLIPLITNRKMREVKR